jgi:hypothetical protein
MFSAGTASARPQGTLVLVPTSGAQLSFVPPASDAATTPTDDPMLNFRRAISEAALLDRQQIEAKCRSAQSQSATREQRFAWAANCEYARR